MKNNNNIFATFHFNPYEWAFFRNAFQFVLPTDTPALRKVKHNIQGVD